MNKQTMLVTGGSKGLGKAIVKYFLENTANNVCTFSRKKTDFVKEMEKKYSGRFFYKSVDARNLEDIKQIITEIYSKFGQVDILINNAGVARDGVLMTQPESEIELMININLFSLIQITKQVTRKMLLQEKGRVINISSIIGISGYRGLSVYSATKAGIDGFTRSLARELGSRNILVNSIAPGYLSTDMSQGLGEGQMKQIIRRTPLKRLGTPEDIIPLIEFLCSEGANFITGHTFVVDGGITV